MEKADCSTSPITGKQQHDSHKVAVTVAIILIIMLGACLRLYDLGGKSLWTDELTTLNDSRELRFQFEAGLNPFRFGITHFRMPVAFRPLYYVVTHAFLYLGESEQVLRLPAALFGILSIYAVFLLGKVLFNRQTALLGTFLIAISAYHIHYSQEARMYSAMFFFSTLSLFFLLRGLKTNRIGYWIGFVLTTTANLYNLPLCLPAIAAEVVIALIFLIRQLARRKNDRSLPSVQSLATSFIISIILVAIIWLPVVIPTADLLKSPDFGVAGNQPAFGVGERTPHAISPLSLQFVSRLFLYLSSGSGEAAHGAPMACYLLLCTIGAIACAVRCRSRLLLFGIWFITPFVILAIAPPHHSFWTRYFIYFQPLYALLAAYGMVTMAQIMARFWKTGRRHNLAQAIAIIIMLGTVSVSSSGAIHDYYRYEKADWRSASGFLEQQLRPEDIIVVGDRWLGACLMHYFSPELRQRSETDPLDIAGVFRGKTAMKLPHDSAVVPDVTDAELERLTRVRRVWYISSYSRLPRIVSEEFQKIKSYPTLGEAGPLEIYSNRPIEANRTR